MKSLALPAAAILALSACAQSTTLRRPDTAATEHHIVCGSLMPASVCYNKANDLCPQGWNTLSESNGFSGRQLRIACPTQLSGR